ncbi:MAG: ABC transporter ATP-binding protein [Thermoproteus sp.]
MKVLLKEIHKIFSDGTHALRGVTLEIPEGKILALLGENGAGKTTLMKILAGIYKPTSGEIYVNGRRVSFRSARDALSAGIAMVHQHLSLASGLTALENIALLDGGGLGPLPKGLRERAAKTAEELGFEVDWDRPVDELPLGVRQRVEIVKALYRGAELIIFDEPTSVLSPPEVKSLFNVLRRLREGGKTVVYITHKIPEVLAVADRAVVLRRGVKVAEFDPPFDSDALVSAMVGDYKPPGIHREGLPGGDDVLRIEDLWVYEEGRAVVQGASFRVREREILAVVGVEGNGQEHLVEALLGLRRAKGSVYMKRPYAYIPDDRFAKALAPELPLYENAIVGMEGEFAKLGVISWRAAKAFTSEIISKFGVVAKSVESDAVTLSGGNQQKLVVGRELSRRAKLIIAHQPTRGLDYATTKYVRALLVEARNSGSGVLLVTSDLDEAYELADTIAVMYRGRIVAAGPVDKMDVDYVGRKMAGL